MTQRTQVVGDTELVDDWSTGDLVAYLQRADPEAAGQVIRVLTARIDRRAGEVSDPRSLLHDMSCAVASLTSAAARIISAACEDHLAVDGAAREHVDGTLAHLAAGGRGVGAIAEGWI